MVYVLSRHSTQHYVMARGYVTRAQVNPWSCTRTCMNATVYANVYCVCIVMQLQGRHERERDSCGQLTVGPLPQWDVFLEVSCGKKGLLIHSAILHRETVFFFLFLFLSVSASSEYASLGSPWDHDAKYFPRHCTDLKGASCKGSNAAPCSQFNVF